MFSATVFDHDDWMEVVMTTSTQEEGRGVERDVRVMDEPEGMSIITEGVWTFLNYEERNTLRDYFLGKLPTVHAPEKEDSLTPEEKAGGGIVASEGTGDA